jgi:hypothetical protein
LRLSSQTLDDIFTYEVVDTGGLTSLATITITIQGANDNPHNLTPAGMTINENLANGLSVGSVTPSDVDAGDSFAYSLANDADGRFNINSATGEITVADASRLDYEDAISHNIIVRVTDTNGDSYDEQFTVSLNDVDEFDVTSPVDANNSPNFVLENATIGTVVGLTASAVDGDATTNAITYSLDDNADGRFAIHATTGVVTVAGAIDREDAASYDIVIRATSADSSTSTSTSTIQIGDVDEENVTTPIDSNSDTNGVYENDANGTAVGMVASAFDADATTNVISYTLTDDAGGRFAIDPTTGVVTILNNALLNRENDRTHTIIVRATSADNSTAEQSFLINVYDIDEFDTSPIVDNNAASDRVNENASNGSIVGLTAFAFDSDDTTSIVTYSLDDDADGRFAINLNTGVVSVADGSRLDFEDAIQHTITVRATSQDGSSSNRSFVIQLNDINEFDVTSPITDLDSTQDFVDENATIGTSVGFESMPTISTGRPTRLFTRSTTMPMADSLSMRPPVKSPWRVRSIAKMLLRTISRFGRQVPIRALVPAR